MTACNVVDWRNEEPGRKLWSIFSVKSLENKGVMVKSMSSSLSSSGTNFF